MELFHWYFSRILPFKGSLNQYIYLHFINVSFSYLDSIEAVIAMCSSKMIVQDHSIIL